MPLLRCRRMTCTALRLHYLQTQPERFVASIVEVYGINSNVARRLVICMKLNDKARNTCAFEHACIELQLPFDK